MSTFEAIEIVGDGVKRIDSNHSQGHRMMNMGFISGSESRYYGSIYPQAGPLIFINQMQQRWSTGCIVTFTGLKSVLTEWITGSIYGGVTYYKENFSGTNVEVSGFISIPAGKMIGSEFFWGNEKIYKLIDMKCSDSNYQWIKAYCLADNGSRILYGMNTELERDAMRLAEKSYFSSPPMCVVCNGTGYVDDEYCLECGGYKYHGYSATGSMLTNKGLDVGIKKESETLISFQHRIWSKKTWIVPTKKNLLEYLSKVLRISKDYLTIDENYRPECYWIVHYPAVIGNNKWTIGNVILPTTTALDSVVAALTPAGMSAILEEYYSTGGDSIIKDYDHPSGYNAPLNSLPGAGFMSGNTSAVIDWFRPDGDSSWENTNFGSNFGRMYFSHIGSGSVGISGGCADLFQHNSGIICFSGFSGNIALWPDHPNLKFYENFNTLEEYQQLLLYDSAFSGISGAITGCPFTKV